MKLQLRIVIGDHLNQGKAAVLYGPLVLCADEALLTGTNHPLQGLALPAITPEAADAKRKPWPGEQVFRGNATERSGGAPFTARLVPFADASSTGQRYKVWLPLAGQPHGSLLAGGVESRSRPGNADGSIIDDNIRSLVVTFDGSRASEDWFAVTMPKPVTASRIVYTHGRNFHGGGWFDTSAGKPRVQI